MWVRSQNKLLLVDIESCYVRNDVLKNYTLVNKEFNLAHYSTKEKVIKVLDMLEEHSQKLYYKEPSWRTNYVFQFPKDDEIDI